MVTEGNETSRARSKGVQASPRPTRRCPISGNWNLWRECTPPDVPRPNRKRRRSRAGFRTTPRSPPGVGTWFPAGSRKRRRNPAGPGWSTGRKLLRKGTKKRSKDLKRSLKLGLFLLSLFVLGQKKERKWQQIKEAACTRCYLPTHFYRQLKKCFITLNKCFQAVRDNMMKAAGCNMFPSKRYSRVNGTQRTTEHIQ